MKSPSPKRLLLKEPISTDYRIDDLEQKYIINLQTLKTPSIYKVEIFRGEYLLSTFQFATSK